ncbi:MAG: glycosyltransferase family 9 protein, partial [Nitrospinota bacterium]
LTFEVPEESNAWLEQFLTSHGISNEHIVISLQPASSRADRRWPPEYFIKLSDLLLKDPRVKIVILGVESEGDLGREIEKNLPGERVINAVGKTTIPQLAALLRRCNFLVTNDTGTMHIAAAVKCRIIGLFFTHALVHETGPFGEGHIVFQADIPCSPCSHQTKCTHMICKEFILPGDVYTVISTLIEGEKLHGLSEKGNFCKNTRLFRSSFTDDGMCSFTPLLKKPIRIPDILAHSYRDIWRYFLENKKEYKTRQSIDRMLVNTVPETVATLKKGFLIDNLDSLLPALEVTLKAFLKIRENSDRGQELTSWIIEESQKQNPDIFRIKGYGEQVQQVDAAIGKVGMVNPETSPVIKMFSFGSENLEGDDYGFLARQTAELYSSLSDESYAMAEHLKGVLGQLSIT